MNTARVFSIVGLATCLIAPSAWSQQPPTETPPPRTDETPAGTATQPPGPPTAAYPLELLGLLAPAQRGPFTLTPSISISEEFNDNIRQNNANREYDFITSFGPAITLIVNKPSYQLSSGYSFNADIYARNSDLTNAFNRQNLIASGVYRATPVLTLSVADSFFYDRNTSVVAVGTSTGRQESWSNTFNPSLRWQVSPKDSLSFGATYGVLRFLDDQRGNGVDSDTYSATATYNRALTARLTGSVGYTFTYINLTQGQEDSKTHEPTVGLSYRFTPTLTGSIRGGPAITQISGETFITGVGAADLTQQFRFGSAGISYSRDISAAGGFGGTNETQRVAATLAATTLYPGLVVSFTPAYSESKSLRSRQVENVDVKTFTLGLLASYQIFRYTTIFAGYTFLHQRSDSTTTVISSSVTDVDQNRVRFGLQFGYPFNFD